MRRPRILQLGFSNSFWPWTVYGVLFLPTVGFTAALLAEARNTGSLLRALAGLALAAVVTGLHLVAIRYNVPHVHDFHATSPHQHQCHRCHLVRRHTNTGWRYPLWSPTGHPSALPVRDGWTSCTRCHVPYPADVFGNPAAP